MLLDNGVAAFDEYRAEVIARTELMDAYNGAALGTYTDAGLSQVEAIDGDGDEECAARDGEVFDIEKADAIEDHPNGTLDWVPVIEEPAKAISAGDLLLAQSEERHAAAIAQMAALAQAQAARPVYVASPEPAVVNVSAPVVNIPALPPRRIVKTVVRDESGRITSVIEEEGEPDGPH